ncbi:hypothetical protein RM572_25390 [Streptomyces sp. DSM 42041]|uniref:Uncharacterized protein n=1 Tax=Streptomyces hazeniae TaxID=3075538 RepID=A0ABU2NZB6_9ACTN|nr:hypothetical protein [Streptomyces sp. DSM 42041]MDT0382099.1 hypothetical protein [Streptomyces sp. DSM 42041]
MKGFLGFVCFVLLSQGVGGLLHTWTDGWFTLWALTHRIGFLDGYHVYVDVLLIVLGLAVGSAGEKVKSSA